jgi:exopolyphosphatase/pppGpp-phosphohydrolase
LTAQAVDSEAGIRRHYASIRTGAPNGTPVTVLHISAEETAVAMGNADEPRAVLSLAIGSQKTAADYFRHHPPTPAEVENAILAVEDEVMRARIMRSEDSALYTTDNAIREIAVLAGASNILSLDALERLFQRWVAVTNGSPASQQGIPDSSAFGATLLIVREFMHHLKFASITLRT